MHAWRTYLVTDAEADLAKANAKAEDLGVFGAPTFVCRGELFWGSDRIDLLAETLATPPARGAPASVMLALRWRDRIEQVSQQLVASNLLISHWRLR